jgi:hypothetical protein
MQKGEPKYPKGTNRRAPKGKSNVTKTNLRVTKTDFHCRALKNTSGAPRSQTPPTTPNSTNQQKKGKEETNKKTIKTKPLEKIKSAQSLFRNLIEKSSET